MRRISDIPAPQERLSRLDAVRRLKMAASPHRYVRGSTERFYDWLSNIQSRQLPEGPPVWICGDCHVGNLGPIAGANEKIQIQIRDLDQTVVGNPAHDLIRLGLSLASAARGSNLPGVTTARMLEAMMDGYERAFEPGFESAEMEEPRSVTLAIRQSRLANWASLARQRLRDPLPNIPLGRRFWPISDDERQEIFALFEREDIRRLVTMLRSREDEAKVEVIDCAYWMKGCSSLGKLRYAALLMVRGRKDKRAAFCLIDIKEAIKEAAPAANDERTPEDPARRVVTGARALSPYLGERMRAGRINETPVIVRELRPQDLKLEIDAIEIDEAVKVAGYLAAVVGKAHARQMNGAMREAWSAELSGNRTRTLDAPTWLWRSVVDLLALHERAYLEHCRRYALAPTGA